LLVYLGLLLLLALVSLPRQNGLLDYRQNSISDCLCLRRKVVQESKVYLQHLRKLKLLALFFTPRCFDKSQELVDHQCQVVMVEPTILNIFKNVWREGLRVEPKEVVLNDIPSFFCHSLQVLSLSVVFFGNQNNQIHNLRDELEKIEGCLHFVFNNDIVGGNGEVLDKLLGLLNSFDAEAFQAV